MDVALARELAPNARTVKTVCDALKIPLPPTGWLMSEKMDGIRAIWHQGKMITRGGNEIVLPENWKVANCHDGFITSAPVGSFKPNAFGIYDILGNVADQLAKKGKKDSSKYLQIALEDLGDWKINHIAVALECAKPRISNHVEAMKESIANICKINESDVGITATSGEGLTSFGRGEGIQAITIITVSKS